MSRKYSSTYSTARSVAGIVLFFGWILVGIAAREAERQAGVKIEGQPEGHWKNGSYKP